VIDSNGDDVSLTIAYFDDVNLDEDLDSLPDLVSCSSDDDDSLYSSVGDEDDIYMMEIVMSDDENTISDAYDSDADEELGGDVNWFLDVDGCWGD